MINNTSSLCKNASLAVGIPENYLSLELVEGSYYWGGVAGRCLFDCRVSSLATRTDEEVIIEFTCKFFSIHIALSDEYSSILSYLETQEAGDMKDVVNPFTLNHQQSTAKYVDHFPLNQ